MCHSLKLYFFFISDSCNPRLNCYTAHKNLCVSGGEVEWQSKSFSCYNLKGRFSIWEQVFCDCDLPERAYWEAEWTDSGKGVSIAVAYSSMDCQTTASRFGRNEESWSLERSNSRLSFFHNNVEILISSSVPSRIGVYVDQPAQILSFYSISDPNSWFEKPNLIFCVPARFAKPLRPGFYVPSGCSVTVAEL